MGKNQRNKRERERERERERGAQRGFRGAIKKRNEKKHQFSAA